MMEKIRKETLRREKRTERRWFILILAASSFLIGGAGYLVRYVWDIRLKDYIPEVTLQAQDRFMAGLWIYIFSVIFILLLADLAVRSYKRKREKDDGW